MIRFHELLKLCAAISIATISSGLAHTVRVSTAPQYNISTVGPMGSGDRPTVVNSANQMVGHDANGQPFYVDSGTLYHPVTPLNATCWTLTGLNDGGRVTGYIKTGAGCTAPVEAVTGVISGPDLAIQPLLNTGGNEYTGCAALSVNDSGEIAGLCDQGTTSRVVFWNPEGNTYGPAMALAWPSHVVAPPAMGSRPPVMTRDIDQFGDIIGQARCADKHSASTTIIWPANQVGSMLAGRSCDSPAANTVRVFADGITSNVTGAPGDESGPVYLAGWCRVSGSGSSQKNKPCLWKLRYGSGKLVLASPTNLDSAASRFARAVDVNANGWIVGDRGNRADTATLWAPHGSGHTEFSLTNLAASAAWVVPGPCHDAMGPAAINLAGDIVGEAVDGGQATGFLMSPKVSNAFDIEVCGRRLHAERGVSGSGCQL